MKFAVTLFLVALVLGARIQAQSGPPPACGPLAAPDVLETFDASLSLPAGWQTSAGTSAWTVTSGTTTSPLTGPTSDITGSGNYVYLEASGVIPGTEFGLEAPCYDVQGLGVPVVNFWYHMLGAAMGTLLVQENQGGTWITVWSRSGNQGDQWVHVEAALTPVNDTVQFRFLGICGASFTSDMAVDHITVQEQTREWETNSSECSLSIDGQTNTYFSGPIQGRGGIGFTHAVGIGSTLVGNPWEILLGVAPAVSALGEGYSTPGGQVINMDLSDPFLTPLFGFQFSVPFAGSGSIPLAFAGPAFIVAQMAIIDPSHPDAYQLSATNEHTVAPFVPLASPEAGPSGDDSFTTHFVGLVEFYGAAYSEIHVSSNGKITFGQGSAAFGPGNIPSQHLVDFPSIGWWTDLDPSVAGVIAVSSPTPSTVRVDYVGVPYFGEPGSSNTFFVELDANGDCIIGGLLGVQANPAALPTLGDFAFLGISNGNQGATDAGPSAFGVSGPNLPANATDAVYNHGLGDPSLLAGGADTLVFSLLQGPLKPNFSWTGF